MSAEKKKQMGVLGLVVALVVVLLGGLVFVGATSGWFDDPKVVLDAEYYTDTPEIKDLSAEEYDNLVEAKKSFVVFVDQGGCVTAERVRGYLEEYMKGAGFSTYRMMFSDMKTTSLHDHVKYYPSVVVMDKGTVRAFLRADVDDDAEMYNNYDAFKNWLAQYL